ncbi:MAG: DNA-binding protein [Dissulfurimicrobium sp.]|uniref:DNA-binding protein n=1 Tax=Dissulfurimicrobium hydrothermale TaxID=1750598 RepID=UPI001EDC817F|nr:DNA-binding protein [Dissulfurimicrobium hydrothermale]UKL13886.1 DNA-binding protein [Dissulfurimicrobium hydrothermale]
MRKGAKTIVILGLSAAVFWGLFVSCSSEGGRRTENKPGQTQTKTDSGHAATTDYLKGKVIQTMDSGGYTYVLLDRGDSQIWVAMPETKVSIGDDLLLDPGIEMKGFTSNTLKRTFDRIVFSSGIISGGHSQGALAAEDGAVHHVLLEKKDVRIERAKGPNSYTIAEIYRTKAEINGKQAVVRGVVVKVSTGIMGKNWVHIQDGSGTQEKGDFDLVVTSQDLPAVGDVVTASGILHSDRDFGAGYRCSAIMEDATIRKD